MGRYLMFVGRYLMFVGRYLMFPITMVILISRFNLLKH